MAENKFKVHNKKEGNGNSIFSRLERAVQLESLFEEGFPVAYLPKILFVFLLGLLYIGNTHYAEKTIRKINNLQTEVEDLRADYTTLKADLMFASKQSEVAKRVQPLGLKESLKPPKKIKVNKGEY
ncbi:MAG TPA: FtsL-like putative cell division protein [Cyclobacteriaceae bacterium]|nr:FtsL-like putative cell division protein [Cyclobacteriaceae bacterium]